MVASVRNLLRWQDEISHVFGGKRSTVMWNPHIFSSGFGLTSDGGYDDHDLSAPNPVPVEREQSQTLPIQPIQGAAGTDTVAAVASVTTSTAAVESVITESVQMDDVVALAPAVSSVVTSIPDIESSAGGDRRTAREWEIEEEDRQLVAKSIPPVAVAMTADYVLVPLEHLDSFMRAGEESFSCTRVLAGVVADTRGCDALCLLRALTSIDPRLGSTTLHAVSGASNNSNSNSSTAVGDQYSPKGLIGPALGFLGAHIRRSNPEDDDNDNETDNERDTEKDGVGATPSTCALFDELPDGVDLGGALAFLVGGVGDTGENPAYAGADLGHTWDRGHSQAKHWQQWLLRNAGLPTKAPTGKGGKALAAMMEQPSTANTANKNTETSGTRKRGIMRESSRDSFKDSLSLVSPEATASTAETSTSTVAESGGANNNTSGFDDSGAGSGAGATAAAKDVPLKVLRGLCVHVAATAPKASQVLKEEVVLATMTDVQRTKYQALCGYIARGERTEEEYLTAKDPSSGNNILLAPMVSPFVGGGAIEQQQLLARGLDALQNVCFHEGLIRMRRGSRKDKEDITTSAVQANNNAQAQAQTNASSQQGQSQQEKQEKEKLDRDKDSSSSNARERALGQKCTYNLHPLCGFAATPAGQDVQGKALEEGGGKLACVVDLLSKRFGGKGKKVVVMVETQRQQSLLHQYLADQGVNHVYAGLLAYRNKDQGESLGWAAAQRAVQVFNSTAAGAGVVLLATHAHLAPPSAIPRNVDAFIIASETWLPGQGQGGGSSMYLRTVQEMAASAGKGASSSPLIIRVALAASVEESMATAAAAHNSPHIGSLQGQVLTELHLSGFKGNACVDAAFLVDAPPGLSKGLKGLKGLTPPGQLITDKAHVGNSKHEKHDKQDLNGSVAIEHIKAVLLSSATSFSQAAGNSGTYGGHFSPSSRSPKMPSITAYPIHVPTPAEAWFAAMRAMASPALNGGDSAASGGQNMGMTSPQATSPDGRGTATNSPRASRGGKSKFEIQEAFSLCWWCLLLCGVVH